MLEKMFSIVKETDLLLIVVLFNRTSVARTPMARLPRSFRFFKKGSCQLLAEVCARSTG